MRRIVIIGGGQAGFQTAASLRERGFDGEVAIVGDEPHPPYQRPPLSKSYLTNAANSLGIQIRPESYYSENDIHLFRAATVTSVDRRSKSIVTEAGLVLGYDKLILALGARNRPLNIEPTGLQDVLYLRNIADAEMLRDRLHAAGRVVIVGGGVIGLEVCSVARAMGIETIVIEVGGRLCARIASDVLSDYLCRHHLSLGAQILLQSKVVRISSEAGRVNAIHLADGRSISTNLVLVCTGVTPNMSLAQECGLETNDGILVNEFLRTSDPDIYAIGDCARYPSAFGSGDLIRIESVPNAIEHGKCAAANIIGEQTPFRSLPWFWSDQGKAKLQIAGLTHGYDRVVAKGKLTEGAFAVFCFHAERLLGVEAINSPAQFALARRVLASTSVTFADLERCDFQLSKLATPSGPDLN